MQFRDLLRLTLTHSTALCHFLALDSFVYKVVCSVRSESENLENPLSARFSLVADHHAESCSNKEHGQIKSEPIHLK